MRGLAISIIVYFVIAIVSISLLMVYMGTNVPQSLRGIYCSFALGISGILPLPESMRISAPQYCKTNVVPLETTYTIESSDPQFISKKIAEYAVACWEIGGNVNVGQSKSCFEIVIKNINGQVTEGSVKSFLPNEYKNIMWWRIGTIKDPKSVGIAYDANTRTIEVV